jgi:hypothetical protein
VWTLVIVFSYSYLFLHKGPEVLFPNSIWGLLGISVGSISAATILGKRKEEDKGGGVASATLVPPVKVNWLADMLSDNGDPSLMRLQMFVWTIATAGLFLRQVWATETLWDIPSSLLILMGISHGGYLVDKGAAAETSMKFEALQPDEVTADAAGNYPDVSLVIVGQNFDPVRMACYIDGVMLTVNANTSTAEQINAVLPAGSALRKTTHDLLLQKPGEKSVLMKDIFTVR